MGTPRIVVVGSSNTDMVVKTERIPAPGETVTGGEFFMPAGGKGANQAVAAARLGAEVTLVAKVGDDMFGKQATENFRKEGILTDHIVADSGNHTGVALIIVDDTGDPVLFSPSCFEIVDTTEPVFWEQSFGDDGERYAYPPDWDKPGFFEDFHDGVDEVRKRFWEDHRKYYGEPRSPTKSPEGWRER